MSVIDNIIYKKISFDILISSELWFNESNSPPPLPKPNIPTPNNQIRRPNMKLPPYALEFMYTYAL